MQKIVAIVQARTGSTRLPGKILKPILGETMLARMLERVKRAKKLDAIIVATTDKPEDDATAELARKCDVRVFRGSEHDVLDRFYKAAREAGVDIVVRLTGDCPLHDPAVIDQIIEHFYSLPGLEYTYKPNNYPEGLDAEVIPFAALTKAWKEASLSSEREHITLYIKKHPEMFRVDGAWVIGSSDYSAMHWSIDTQADFEFVTKVFEQLYPTNPSFTKDDVLALLAQHPELLEINKDGTGYEGVAKSIKEDEEFKKRYL